jgi:N-acetylglutamate synthase-like GNAT family acetyltransferase
METEPLVRPSTAQCPYCGTCLNRDAASWLVAFECSRCGRFSDFGSAYVSQKAKSAGSTRRVANGDDAYPRSMSVVLPAEGAMLDGVLEGMYPIDCHGLTRRAYARFRLAQTRTDWGRRHQRQFSLVEGDQLVAGATQFDLAAVLDDRPLRVCAIASVFTDPAHRGEGHDLVLVEQLLQRATREGAEMALIFSERNATAFATSDFVEMSTTEVTLDVAEPARHGAPMTLIRGGEPRDLAAIVAMGRVRADPFRFHLDRDVDFVRHTITRTRLLAGLSLSGTRQLLFSIAEEGITAAAYVVISTVGSDWTVEECGDRDPSGARVGAILQALIAREPAERRPTIRAWLPHGFAPPQVTIVSRAAPTEIVLTRQLRPSAMPRPLSDDEVLYWHGDIF